jgi:hypothetical protein
MESRYLFRLVALMRLLQLMPLLCVLPLLRLLCLAMPTIKRNALPFESTQEMQGLPAYTLLLRLPNQSLAYLQLGRICL